MEHYFDYDCIDMSKEQFVVAYGNFSNYLVSNYGTIKNRLTGHIMKQQVNSHGYRYVQLVETGRPGSHKRSFPALPRHNRYSYRGTIAGRGGERYYAKIADLRYHKSLDEPKPRGGHQKNANKSHWKDWELETRSDCANWKAHKKYHHQYEQKIFREEKQIKKSSRH